MNEFVFLGGLVATLLLVVVLFIKLISFNKKLSSCYQRIVILKKELDVAKNEVQELRSGLMGMGKRIAKLQNMTHEVSEKQVEIQHVDADSKLYSRAVKMVELGADIEEIISECELPRAEAELLFSIHGKNQ
ncbi:DUF2802 domain-containing protein [Flocculibacter collagenilyticus]|uniref:DUF2802 domain-containing protein n=1 Tax=Flocculibacter collagenilyticus TaxID=2744479 RepID=UPI0018F6B2BE|nr:DUF2802 domain-containing protein [Flocculibacter collagenilyticus]